MVRQVPLTQGKVALVDDEDYERVSAFLWHIIREPRKHLPDVFYARRTILAGEASGKPGNIKEYLHHFILGSHTRVDHADHDGLNNQRSNIRPAESYQNAANTRRRLPGKTSRFRGVTWIKSSNRWQAAIGAKGQKFYLGIFGSEEDAARAYDHAAIQHFGEYAILNFPDATPNEPHMIQLKNKCSECDGSGYYFYCDDRLDGQCIYGWDLPCDECEGRGWNFEAVKPADPKWAEMWREMNPEEVKESVNHD